MLFMLAPLVVVCLVAFTPENTLSLPTAGFSLRWFSAVFERADFLDAFYNSLKLAALAATLATLIAVPAGLAITRYSFPGQGFLNGLLLSPIIIPHLVLGVALLRLFALLGVNGSFAWLVFAHVVVITPTCYAWYWLQPSESIAVPSRLRKAWALAGSRCSARSPCR